MSGWDASAAAWIAIQGETGDFGRVHVLDVPMLALVDERAPARMLDVGCGEGRFCRMLAARGITTTGVDPAAALIARPYRPLTMAASRLARTASKNFSVVIQA
ncbi:class I SAM-dependent methyltransferase [Sandarakinorhabdus limnophila]|uniref:class I SAM-dependent methyltransferase n=1 Tax=Sandarakinorhabdus limnophila TaxID=210512 RepID=UPI0026F22411|nr:methyltransferase domain-containing protein [Sandarakinorhabdus limnophila]